jgi:hypothetical protein
MSPSAFQPFSQLPKELRETIWHYSTPSTTTIHIREGADLDVTYVSPPPGQALATRESRAAYLSQGYKTYSIYTNEDWTDIHISKDSIIQLVITPSKNPTANLNMTWTELQVILHNALLVVKKLHISCSKPERLVRLWMLPEGGLVAPGKSHWDEDLFREYRESLHPELRITTSTATLADLDKRGSQEKVDVRELVKERVVQGLGPKTHFSTTEALQLVGEEQAKEVEEWEEMQSMPVSTGGGGELTEKAIAKFIHETGWTPKNSTPSSEYSVDVVYDGELWLTVVA